MPPRTWLLAIGVAAGLLTMSVGLFEVSERNRNLIRYAEQECAHLQTTRTKFDANDPYISCVNGSVSQHALNPGSTWFIFGGAVVVISISMYWRTRPRTEPLM